MKLMRFRLFAAHRKLAQVLSSGQYLVQRMGRTGPVSLYYLPDGNKGFFAEIAYDAHWCRATFLRSFRRTRRLYPYVAALPLPSAL